MKKFLFSILSGTLFGIVVIFYIQYDSLISLFEETPNTLPNPISSENSNPTRPSWELAMPSLGGNEVAPENFDPNELRAQRQQAMSDFLSARNAEIAAINQALTQLSEGSFFHNVPDEMEVGIPVTIESGIAIGDVKAVLERHNLSGEFLTETEVRYDPLGTELELIASSDAFDKEVISEGRRYILPDDEPIWSWRIVPKKAGQHLIVIKVNVELISPLTGAVYPKEFTTFRQHRLVKVNYAQSIRSFASENWKEILTRIIGPGTVFGFVGWWVGNRRQKKLERKRQPAGFIGESLKNSGKRK